METKKNENDFRDYIVSIKETQDGISNLRRIILLIEDFSIYKTSNSTASENEFNLRFDNAPINTIIDLMAIIYYNIELGLSEVENNIITRRYSRQFVWSLC